VSELLLTRRWAVRAVILVVVVAACGWLGWWQWGQARVEVVRTPPAGVASLTDVHEPGQPVDDRQIGRLVSLSGEFDAEREVSVVDRQDDGRPGTWVVTAFLPRGAGGAVIPVVRGWLPAGADVPGPPPGNQELIAWLEPAESDALRERGRDPLPVGQVEVVSSAQLLSLWQPPLFQGFVIQKEPAPEAPLVAVAPPALTVTGEMDWQNAAYGVQWWLFGLFAVFWFVRMLRVENEDVSALAEARDQNGLDTMGAGDDPKTRGATE
jgi:surfeit locus 1 family protein